MDRRPPLAVSPRRLRPRPGRSSYGLSPVSSSFQITPPGSMKKAHTPVRSSVCALPPSYPDPSPRAKLGYAPAPTPTRASGKENIGVHGDPALNLAAADASTDNWAEMVAPTSPLFERGRLYDLYSARRNERLKRKHGWYTAGEEEAGAMAQDPCVAVELSKRRGAKKATAESAVRRTMPAAEFSSLSHRAGGFSSLSHRAGGGMSAMRSSLVSSKEMKKASAASYCATTAKPSAVKERRAGVRSSARRI